MVPRACHAESPTTGVLEAGSQPLLCLGTWVQGKKGARKARSGADNSLVGVQGLGRRRQSRAEDTGQSDTGRYQRGGQGCLGTGRIQDRCYKGAGVILDRYYMG